MTARGIGALAYRALMDEVDTTPKPGLVDRRNAGAHSDMDYTTFAASALALRPHLEAFARTGERLRHLSEPELLAALRPMGLAAEADMYAATVGVNTHKGAVFSLGLLCAAAGWRTAKGLDLQPASVCGTVAAMTAGISSELSSVGDTAGSRVFRRYGVHGARGEAESGFQSARACGLPMLKAALNRGDDRNTACVRALMALMAQVVDTNVLGRHDMETALWLQGEARRVLARFSLEAVAALDDTLIARNISPGGTADLLAVTLMLYGLTDLGGSPQTPTNFLEKV